MIGIQHWLCCVVQVTSLVTPTLSFLAGDRPGRRVWLGCGVAMAGTVLLTLDHAPSAPSSGLQQAAIGADASISASQKDVCSPSASVCRIYQSLLPLPEGTLILQLSTYIAGASADLLQTCAYIRTRSHKDDECRRGRMCAGCCILLFLGDGAPEQDSSSCSLPESGHCQISGSRCCIARLAGRCGSQQCKPCVGFLMIQRHALIQDWP